MTSQLSPRRWNAYVLTLKRRRLFFGMPLNGPTTRQRLLIPTALPQKRTQLSLHKSRRLLLAAIAGLALGTLSACATSPVPLRAVLPEPPTDFGRPVTAPLPHVGQSPKAYSASVLSALAQANDRLLNDAAFYSDVKVRLGHE
jgi:hypothetical protein